MSEVQKVYWKRGSRIKATPEKAFKEMERIRIKNGGKLTAGLLLIESRKARSPLHKDFEWDDSVAAEEFRLTQARKMLRSLEVVYVETPNIPPTRQYITVTEEARESTPERTIYLSTMEALKDPVARDQLLGNAIRDAITYRRKYAALSELAAVFIAIDGAIEHIKVG